MTKAYKFQASLCAVTFIPLIGFPLGAYFNGPMDIESTSWSMSVIFIGYCHVASTLFFYVDVDAKGLRETYNRFFILIPLIIVLCVSLAFQYGSNAVRAAINGFHFAWLFYHYQKQNYGVVSFSLRGLPPRIANALWHMLLFAAISGFFSYIRIFTVDAQIQLSGLLKNISGVSALPLADVFLAVALAAYSISALFLVKILYVSPEIRNNKFSLAFTLGGFAFFLPTFMAESGALVIFWSFALSHGLQYLIFMSVTAAPKKLNSESDFKLIQFKPLIALAVAALTGGAFLIFAREVAYGLVIGLTWGHFVIDSRVWKLRLSESRAYVFNKFSFMF